MENTFFAVIGLVAWAVILLLGIAIMRTYLSVTGKRAANSFSPTGEDVSEFSRRLVRAHANCYEFLPFVLALMLFAVASGQTAITEPLALVVLITRVAQSVIHVASTNRVAVLSRFAMFIPQILIAIYWIVGFINL